MTTAKIHLRRKNRNQRLAPPVCGVRGAYLHTGFIMNVTCCRCLRLEIARLENERDLQQEALTAINLDLRKVRALWFNHAKKSVITNRKERVTFICAPTKSKSR